MRKKITFTEEELSGYGKWWWRCKKVVCIDNFGADNVLTFGKVYDTISTSKSIITIKNDLNRTGFYTPDRFVSPEIWRDKKLNDLGI